MLSLTSHAPPLRAVSPTWRRLTVWMSIHLVFLAVNTSGEALNLPEWFNSSRLAALLSVPLVFHLFRRREGERQNRETASMAALIAALMATMGLGALSGSLNQTLETPEGLFSVLSWALCALALLVGYGAYSRIDPPLLARSMIVVAGAVVGIATILVLVEAGGIPRTRGEALAAGTEVLPEGSNKFLNGIFALLIVPMGVAVRFIDAPRKWRTLAVAALMPAILLATVMGSRQFLGAVIVFLLLGFARRVWHACQLRRNGGLSARGIVAVMAVATMTLAVLTLLELGEYAFDRFVLDTERHLLDGSRRTLVYLDLFEIIRESPLLGVGPGGYFLAAGVRPDSGFLELASEYGVVALAIVFSSVFVVLGLQWLKNSRSAESPTKQLHAVLLFATTAHFFWSNLFNELVREPFVWMLIGGVIGLSNRLALPLSARSGGEA